MKDKKYVKDYKIENGKPVYAGELYILNNAPSEIKRTEGVAFVSCIVVALLYIAAFLQNGIAGRTLYVVFPYAFSLIPLFLLFGAVIKFVRLSTTFTKKQCDKTVIRAKNNSFYLALFLSATLSAETLMLFFRTDELSLPGDALFIVFTFCQCVAMWFTSCRLKRLSASPLPTEKEEKIVNDRED